MHCEYKNSRFLWGGPVEPLGLELSSSTSKKLIFHSTEDSLQDGKGLQYPIFQPGYNEEVRGRSQRVIRRKRESEKTIVSGHCNPSPLWTYIGMKPWSLKVQIFISCFQ